MLIFTTAFVFVANAPVTGPRWFSRNGVGLLSPLSIGPPPSQFLALRGMEGYALTRGRLGTIHRHHASSETAVILRGKIQWLFYDENAKETERLVLDAQGEPRLLNVENPDGIRWSA